MKECTFSVSKINFKNYFLLRITTNNVENNISRLILIVFSCKKSRDISIDNRKRDSSTVTVIETGSSIRRH